MVTRNPDMRVRSVELTAIGELQGAEHPSNITTTLPQFGQFLGGNCFAEGKATRLASA